MPALSSNVTVKAFGGTITVSTDVHSAKAKAPSNVTVCLGAGETSTPHDAVRVTTQMRCSVCGDIHVSRTSKARQVGNDFVVLTDEDLVAASGDLTPLKKQMDLLPHPTSQIDLVTAPGESVNYLAPRAGFEQAYATLAHVIETHPEVTFMTRWVPRTRMSVYSLHVLPTADGRKVIVMRERVAGDQLKPSPDFDGQPADVAYADIAAQFLTLATSDFDLDTYRDTTQERLDALIAGRSGIALTGAPKTMPAVSQASVADLASMVAELRKAAAKPVRKRAPRARKAVAATAPVADTIED